MRTLLVVIALAFSTSVAAAPTVTQLAADRVAAAAKAYTSIVARLDVVQPEDIYRWSVRWLDAQLDDPATGKAIPQAFADHAKRMTELEAHVQEGYQKGLKPAFDLAAVNYYKLEAELWVARRKK